jgi:hypothetical protein
MTVPAQISLSICFLWGLIYLLLCWFVRHRGLFVAVTLAGLVVTWFVCIGTLVLYFDLTIAWATTEAEVDGVVGGDGAKLVFTGLFFGPAACVVLAIAGMVVHYVRSLDCLCPSISEVRTVALKVTDSIQSDNPYSPPIPPDRVG